MININDQKSNRGSAALNNNQHALQQLQVCDVLVNENHEKQNNLLLDTSQTHQEYFQQYLPITRISRIRSEIIEQPKLCPWWMLFLVILLSISMAFTSVYFYFFHKITQKKLQGVMQGLNEQYIINKCLQGYFLYQQRCITCPKDTEWNGSQCVFSPNNIFLQTERQTSKIKKDQSFDSKNLIFKPQNFKQLIHRLYSISF